MSSFGGNNSDKTPGQELRGPGPGSGGQAPVHNRQRGYSLRSQLLNRGRTATAPERPSSPIELTSGVQFNSHSIDGNPTSQSSFTHRRSSSHGRPSPNSDANNAAINVEDPTYIYADMLDVNGNGDYSLKDSSINTGGSKKLSKSSPGISTPSSDILPNYSFWASKTVSKPQKFARKLKSVSLKVQDYILQKKRPPKSVGGRTLPIKLTTADEGLELIDERTHKNYIPNTIVSSIYTSYNFLPRQLIFQFSKLANVYFLFVSILQMIPSWSTTGTYTTIIPLLVFMAISMGREGYDDWRRHLQDKLENSKTTRVVRLRSDYRRYSSRLAASSSANLTNEHTLLHDDEGDIDGSVPARRTTTASTMNNSSSPFYFKKVSWKDVKVGDILKLKQNEAIPADVIVLSSEGYANTSYIETMDLDGETNLKSRSAVPDLADAVSDPESFINLTDCSVTIEDPNIDLYNFEGTLQCKGKEYPLSSNNVIYRGSILRNTPSIMALVVFTGEETKIRMNALQDPRAKAPKLQKKVNNIVVFMVCFVLGLSIFCTAASRIYWNDQGSNMWFLRGLEVGVVPNFMGFIIMLNTLIPLSLYVSLEIVKVSQMLLLQKDVDMYHAPSNTPCEAHTATINEELGQVHYIFSDKTGTLTDNVMVFRKLSIAGHAWLHDLDMQLEAAVAETQQLNHESMELDPATTGRLFHKAKKGPGAGTTISRPTEHPSPIVRTSTDVGGPSHAISRTSTDVIFRQVAALPRKSIGMLPRASMASLKRSTSVATHWKSNANPDKVQNVNNTLQLLEYMLKNPYSVYTKKAKFFLLSMALCHTCVPDIEKDDEGNSPEIESLQYQAASPDELALIEAARDLGYLLIDRQNNNVTIRTYPNGFDEDPVDEVYQVLEVIEFSSARKRMSAVVSFPDGRICVFCKGADNVIIDRLRLSDVAKSKSEEISREVSLRKAAEADIIIERNSLSSLGEAGFLPGGRSSLGGGRPSLSGLGRASIDKRTALVSLDGFLQRTHKDEDIDMIAESSRQSFNLASQRKYGENASRSSVEMGQRRSIDVRKKKSTATVKSDHRQEIKEPESTVPEPEEIQIDDHLALNDGYVIEKTLQHIEEFSTEGLRTLLYGHRFLTKSEFDSWNKLYQDARTSLTDRQEKIEKVGEMIEKDFDLTGATAIEDKLQEGVPEAIEKLTRAHIKIWMLTGDKRETAINIGYSCRLIKDYSTVVVLRSDEGDVAAKMASAMVELDSGDRVAHCVVVVDGMTLAHIQEDITLMSLFVDLGVKANSVICCRASPSQKSAMVMAVRKKLKKAITLAIGDGANDIAMIQSADVGIGITGREGLQAARSSDYSIAQFRFLLKLLLVHGRWNYVRTCKYVLGTFYKEFLFFLTQAIYQRNTMFSGTSLYETWSLSMFNTLFTSLPVICLGVFEQDLSPTTLIAVPELYSVGQRNERFGLVLFLCWMFVAAAESVGVSFLSSYLYGFEALRDNTLYPLGVIVFTTVVMIITTKLNLMEMHNITVINWAVVIISNGGWLCWCMFLSYIYRKSPSKIYFVGEAIFKTFGKDLSFWSSILVIYGVAITFELLIRFIRMMFFPTETDIFQELEKDSDILYRLEKEAYSELKQGWEARGDIESRFVGNEDGTARRPSTANSLMRRHDNDEDVYPLVDISGDNVTMSPTGALSPMAAAAGSGKKILRKLPFGHRKTSEEYEREIFELLKKREQQINNEG